MTLELSCELDKDARYRFFEEGHAKISVTNSTQKRIQIFSSFIRFKNSNLPQFEEKCDVAIEPNETKYLPEINFTINLRAKEWTTFFAIGIEYRRPYA